MYLIDTHYVRPGLAASHLVVDDGRAAFVDTGAAPAAPRLLAALDELGIAREQVDYLFLTHVHLDHAGGAGQLIEALPNARAVLHPRGAPHMIDPTKLIAGSIAVYGEALFNQLYGELRADPGRTRRRRPRTARGSGSARRTFEFIDAPGHARHHHCPIDLDHREIYSGDNFGICYREFDTAAGSVHAADDDAGAVRPGCVPPHDRPADVVSRRGGSTRRTSGRSTDLERLARDLHAEIVEFVRIARTHADAPDRRAAHRSRHVPVLQRRASTSTAMPATSPAATSCSTTT